MCARVVFGIAVVCESTLIEAEVGRCDKPELPRPFPFHQRFLQRRNMLGKQPCLLRTTCSRSLLIPCDDAEGEPATFCNYEQVTEKNPSPAYSAPCKIVIGFDIGAEKKKPPPDACESPRSVLDTLALLPSQHVATRSPRSGLGSLLTAKSGSGVGLEIGAQIQAKEVGVHASSIAGSFKATFPLQNSLQEAYPDKMSLSVRSSHCHSKGTGWLDKASNSDFMDSDNLSWKMQAPCVLSVEDEHLDADISPLQGQVMFMPPSQDRNSNFTDMNISPYQSRAFNACHNMGVKDDCLDADIFQQCSQAAGQIGDLQATPRNVTNKEYIKTQAPPWQSGVPYAPGSEGLANGCENAHVPTWQSGTLSLCEDGCVDTHIALRQRQALHQVSLDMECEDISIQRSIFSAASPPSCPHSLITSSSGFLKVCAFCGHSLRLGKDIFMYRGDQAFCSAECRYQKIVLDERNEKRGS